MLKTVIFAATCPLIGLLALAQEPPPPRPGGPPPPPKAKSAGEEIRKTYDLLRRVRSDSDSGGRHERIGDWTERATEIYRRALEAHKGGHEREARELGTAAHDLARAADHARNAARLDRQDPGLPLPPDDEGPEDLGERTRRDLRRAYDRVRSAGEAGPAADAQFYASAAKDLYNAARADVEAGRIERGGELARAAEAMTHVPEHLRHAADPGHRPEEAEGGPHGDTERPRGGPGGGPLPPPID